jgi:hypothetical protein
MKMVIFWVVAPCSLEEVYRHFRGACCHMRLLARIMEAVSTSETSVNFYQTIRRNNPEDSHLDRVQLVYWMLFMVSKFRNSVSKFREGIVRTNQ